MELVHSTRKLAVERMLFGFGMADDWRPNALTLCLVCSGVGGRTGRLAGRRFSEPQALVLMLCT